MAYEQIILEREGPIAILTLYQPEKLNALSGQMSAEIGLATEELQADREIRAVIMTGAGRGFCSGADLTSMGGSHQRAKTEVMGGVVMQIRGLNKPVIAAINGVAAGAGFGLALASDIMIASESARFSSIFIKRALVPDYGVSYFLPRWVGLHKAIEMVYTGDMVDAQEAYRIGLVSKVVPADQLMATAKELAQRLAASAPLAIQMCKPIMYMSLDNNLDLQLHREHWSQIICLASDDFKESVQAFFEKRDPKFTGN